MCIRDRGDGPVVVAVGEDGIQTYRRVEVSLGPAKVSQIVLGLSLIHIVPIHRYRVLPVNDEGGIWAACRSRSHKCDDQGGIRAVPRPGWHTERQMNDLSGIRADCRSRSHMWDNQGGIHARSLTIAVKKSASYCVISGAPVPNALSRTFRCV